MVDIMPKSGLNSSSRKNKILKPHNPFDRKPVKELQSEQQYLGDSQPVLLIDCPSFSSDSHSAEENPMLKCRRYHQTFLRRYGSRLKNKSLAGNRVIADNTSTIIDTQEVPLREDYVHEENHISPKPQSIKINKKASIALVPYSCWDDDNSDHDEEIDALMITSLTNSLTFEQAWYNADIPESENPWFEQYRQCAAHRISELQQTAWASQRNRFRLRSNNTA